MRTTVGRGVVWSVLGLLFSIAGVVVAVVVASRAFTGSMNGTIETIASSYLPYALASLALFVLGGYCTRKSYARVGRHGPRSGAVRDRGLSEDEAVLEEYGYRVPADESDGEPQYEYDDGVVYVRCGKCGVRNEQEFTFCSNCSSRLDG